VVEGKTNSLLRVFDVPLFGFRNSVEKLCDSWVQTRGYEACVFCMPINGSAHETQSFSTELRKTKKVPTNT